MLEPLDVLRLYRAHDYSIPDAFASRLNKFGGRPFCLWNGRELTWFEFDRLARRTDTVLQRMGIGPGDRLAIVAQNHLAHLALLFASARRGAVLVPVNPAFKSAELGYVLGNADAKVVVCDASTIHTVRESCNEHGLAPTLLPIEEGGQGNLDLMMLVSDAEPDDSTPVGRADHTCLIIYTSGTTGFPKGVMHSQRNFVLAGEAFVQRLHVQPDERSMIVLPLFHMNALFYSVAGAVAAGAAVVLAPRFSASTFWRTAREHGVTAVNLIESACRILTLRPRDEFDASHRLRKVYGVRGEAEDTFRNVFGIPHLISGYGMTEIPGVTSSPFAGEQRTGSMGMLASHPDPSVEWARCRIVDDAGIDVADGQVGELLVKTPIVTQGYFRDPDQTAKAFRDGWFITGDLVRRDDDGYYYFVSRKKDIIRRRGENIAGAEIDRVVGEHPGVKAVAAIGVPSDLGEDEILVAVVADPAHSLSADSIADWCRTRLAPMKVPRYVAFVDDLPYTATHKILKSALRSDANLLARAVDVTAPRHPP